MKTPPMTKRQMSILATKLDRQREKLEETVNALLAAGAVVYAKRAKPYVQGVQVVPPEPFDPKKWTPPPEGTKMARCIELFKQHYTVDSGITSNEMISIFMREVGMEREGATTYLYRLKVYRSHDLI